MGKGSGVFCAMLFSCLLLTGCAENPTEDIVVNKNEGKLEQAIQRENKKDSDTSVPEKYTDQFQADGEKIEVSVDASVTGLEENKPVVRVKPHLITEEEAKRWADVLFEGATAYEPGEKSKTEIEDRILQLKERISDQDKILEDYGSQEEADRIKKELEEEIKEYEKHQPVILMKKFHVHGNFIHMAIMMTCQCPHPVMQIMKGWTKPAS